MDYGVIDTTYRSRITLLDMLEKRGYNTEPYRRFSPQEIDDMIGPHALGDALRMDLQRTSGEGPEKCVVVYRFQRQKQKIPTLLNELLGDDTPEQLRVNPATTEVIAILYEPVVDTFHAAALNQWKKNKLRIRFFEGRKIIVDPSSFAIVPKHEKMAAEDVMALRKEYYLQADVLHNWIRFHEDPQARWLGLVPGDVVKITRPSPSSGEYVVYRVCVP
jgi:DNA-directed RNA polymerase subunit H (RpoH/RPB5)